MGKKLFVTLMLVSVSAFAANEHETLKKELSAPAVVVQPQILKPVITAQPVQEDSTASVATTQSSQPTLVQPAQAAATIPVQPIYVVEKQPTTVVEDVPLKESKADQLRKQRENVERQTEERIVEKLEGDRVRAEQERAQKIMDVMETKPVVQPEPVAAKPVVEAAPIAVPPPAITQVKEELKEVKDDNKSGKMSANALIGISSYTSGDNVKGGTAFGAGIGYLVDPQMSFNLEFLYSRFDIENPSSFYYDPLTNFYYPYVTRMDQYNISANMKYRVIENSRLSPYIGGILSYTIRSFSNGNLPYQNIQNANLSSWAMDAGLMGGVDFALSDKFSIGMDLRYLFNITYNLNNVQNRNYYFSGITPGTKAIESLNYYIVGINGLLTF